MDRVRTDVPAGARSGPSDRADRSMSLLVDMMANTLDEAYAERAAAGTGGSARGQQASARRSRPGGRRRLWPLAGLVAVGLLTGTAVASVRDRAQADAGVRTGLLVEVVERTERVAALAARATRLRDEVTAVRAQALGADAAGRAAARRLARLELAAGTTAVVGPGLVVRLDDAREGDAAGPDPLRGGSVPEGRVRDSDVQDAVNGLWAAGAEAVAVDGQRLTALSAIRSAGESILVDLRPISPPYVVHALGDPADLEVGFVAGPSGRRLQTLTSLYGIAVEVERADELQLPGAGAPVLRFAEPVAATAPVGRPS
jgi:uncharacterized protein YlxW (UPF0749 family)